MAKLSFSKSQYRLVKSEIIDVFEGDKELLGLVVSDYICLKIFAEFDFNLNIIFKQFIRLHGGEPKEKEIGHMKPNEIKKELKKRFFIPEEHLSFLDRYINFTRFIINRHQIGHTNQCSSISFEAAADYMNDADEILEEIYRVLHTYGKFKPKKKANKVIRCWNKCINFLVVK